MNEWRLIETAPKDCDIWLWDGSSMGVGRWLSWCRDSNGLVIGLEKESKRRPERFRDRWEWGDEGFVMDPPPIMWQPLPEPPK